MRVIYGYDPETKRRISTQALLEQIYKALDEDETEFEIFAEGQHDIGGPWWNKEGKPLYFKIHNPGQRVGSMGMEGTTIEIEGSAPADVGWLNSGATIILKGDGGDTTGHAAAGGKIYVGGRAGTRTGALMKHDPKKDPPELWILKNVGSFSFEFMGGGIAVVCGWDSDRDSVLGDRACVGMIGGKVYFRGNAKGISENDVRVFPLDENDIEFLKNGLKEFLEKIEKTELYDELTKDWNEWHKIIPKSHEEKELEKKAKHISVKEFRETKWVEGGIFSDVFYDTGEKIALVNRGKNRLRYPMWENGKYMAPCNFACPSFIPTQKRTKLIREGRYKDAVDLILEYSPFPASVCGEVCPNLCMMECTRGDFDEPIDIKRLGQAALERETPAMPPYNGKKVVVIGGGPGGISVAWQLRRMGYEVHIYEKEEKLGGKMYYAIPKDRLPERVLEREIRMIYEVGIKVHTNTEVDRELYLKLKKEFDAVVVAVGAHDPRVIPIPGGERIIKGLDFLKKVNRGEKVKVGEKVVVIGAGNAAMDVGYEAYKHGAKHVTFIDIAKPKAYQHEMDRLLELGATIIWPASAEEITENGVKLKDGRFLEADTVFISIGESPDLSFLDKEDITERRTIKVNDKYQIPSDPKVFAVGDTIIPGLITDAIGTGYQVARSIDAYLNGKEYKKPERKGIDKNRLHTDYFKLYRKTKNRDKAFDKDLESQLCVSCGWCRDCRMCLETCPTGAITRRDLGNGEFEYVSDPEVCIGCGMCAGVCPSGIWTMYSNLQNASQSFDEEAD